VVVGALKQVQNDVRCYKFGMTVGAKIYTPLAPLKKGIKLV